LREFESLTDDERVARRQAHNKLDTGCFQHYHQLLFMPPMLHFGMEQVGADQLHLLYLNIFKHLYKYTCHEGLPESKKKLARRYLISRNFYSYSADSTDDDPVSHWIGREAKRFICEAHIHLPFLLRVAAAPPDLVAELAREALGAF